ncbi:MAG TPA: TIGR01777 family oxidoreductase [Polyangia bacterium]|jgi:TIGR01777 family protein|nr:TIGR01777 family oxidoreductase [Polyangia bacterium]
MRILISGASGLIGRALTERLRSAGDTVQTLVRRQPKQSEGEIAWDPEAGVLDSSRLDGVNAVVHLAGKPIDLRWTEATKKSILDSRVKGTRMLAQAVAQARPKVFICASAVGFYGSRGDELLDENSAQGQGFLADVCRQWEEAAAPARDAGLRTVHLRTGIVLSRQGGMLARVLPRFKMGAGVVVGTGRQWMSWISLADATAAIQHAIAAADLSGPVNLTTAQPVPNGEFTRTLGKILSRPTLLPFPAFAVKLLFGEMGDELLLAGQKALPKKLLASGFHFAHSDIESALRWALAH